MTSKKKVKMTYGVGVALGVLILISASLTARVFALRDSFCESLAQVEIAFYCGDGSQAVLAAKRVEKLAASGSRYDRRRALENLFLAYELDGQFEKALKTREQFISEFGGRGVSSDVALAKVRVACKTERAKEAFIGYCLYVQKYLETNMSEDESFNDDLRVLLTARNDITMEMDNFRMRLSPFFEFEDFLNFVEKEYSALGEPKEYERAVEFFRAIQKNKKNLDSEIARLRSFNPSTLRAELEKERSGEQNEFRLNGANKEMPPQ